MPAMLLLLTSLLLAPAAARDLPLADFGLPPDAAEDSLDRETAALVDRFALPPAEQPQLRAALQRQVALRLERMQGLELDQEGLERRVVGYEAWKLGTTVTAGVSPKRYFGYFDGQGDTAAKEARLWDASVRSAAVVNRWLTAEGRTFRVTEAEIAVTFLAEGGALWLQRDDELVDSMHPVYDVGLDDIYTGSREFSALMRALDAELGTDLGGMIDPRRQLVHLMNLEEGVAGTALMWAWEKQIAQDKMAAAGYGKLEEQDARRQFIIGSLVYNSGLLHGPQRWQQIQDFDAAQVVWDKSEANAHQRPRLPVLPAADMLRHLVSGADYPEQPTSWLAIYHVLQRFGAYEALARFDGLIDAQGRLDVTRRPERPPPPPPPKPLSPTAGGLAMNAPLVVALLVLVALGLAWRRHQKNADLI